MSQAGSSGVNGGGGGGSITFTGDTGTPFTTSSVTIFSNNASNNSGASVAFNASTPNLTLNLSDGLGNTYLGKGCGVVGVGLSNVAIGQNALSAVTSNSAEYNVIVGFDSATSITTGSHNVAMGEASLNSLTTGIGNVAIGNQAGVNLQGSGSYNTYLGDVAGGSGHTTSGSYNIIIGYLAGEATDSSESSNIYISNVGVAGESNVTRIGTQGTGNSQQNTCIIAGITGSTVTGTAVLCDSNGNLGTISSSERYKENIRDISSDTSILHLRPVSFNYKKTDEKAFGFIAEEVDKIFPSLCVYDKEGKPDSVKYHYMYALLLEEIKRLNLRVQDLENKVK